MFLLAAAFGLTQGPQPAFSRGIQSAYFDKGAVVSDSQIASQVGIDLLRKGGNAVDAAVGVGFALAVTFPAAGNLGGGGFMIVRMADGRSVAIDYRETAPRRSTRDMYKNPADSLRGYLASGTPGTPMGMWEAHRRFGKLPWHDVVSPSVRLAQNGFAIPSDLAQDLRSAAKGFEPFPAAYEQFTRKGRFYAAGETFRQPDLAKTLERIASQGPKGFYEGETARLIERAMKDNGGLIDAQDLRGYKAKLREPIRGSYRGYEILTMPPPSSGGIALLQMLGMVERDDIAKLGFQSSASLHLMVEAMKRAFADRAEHLGDPDFASVPMKELLDRNYISRMRASIGDKATPAESIRSRPPSRAGQGMHTTHYSVIDAQGNAVSNTYTLNTGFGSGVVIPGTGVLMNNEMDDFATQPGKPNVFGLIQSAKNEVAPNKRPLSSMTPTILLRDGKVAAALGSPGGPTIINTVFQTILNLADHGMSPQQAVSAARFHHQWMPDLIAWEPFGLSADVRAALEARGHKFAPPGRLMGSCHVVAVDASGKKRVGVDPRVASAGAAGY
jgi:gamma-glutamyltranspeptidase / glutathione hydrolase